MLHLAHKIRGTTVRAVDGEIGTLDDFIFEQSHWAVRYLVVGTGSWLNERRVLLSPMSVAGSWDRAGISLRVRKSQIERSPDLDLKMLGRSNESLLLHHYGQPIYWEGAGAWGTFDTPTALAGGRPEQAQAEDANGASSEHLQSTEELTGYHIRAADGEIGHVDDFFIGEESWRIRYLLVDTSNWIGGRSVLVSTEIVENIDRAGRVLHVSDSREDIRDSPTYDSIVETLSPAETGPPFLFI